MGQEEGKVAKAVAGELGIADSLPDPIAVLDSHGRVTGVNAAWRRHSLVQNKPLQKLNTTRRGGDPSGVGAFYLDLCRKKRTSNLPPMPAPADVQKGLREVLEGGQDRFRLEYPKKLGTAWIWFELTISPCSSERDGAVVVQRELRERRFLGNASDNQLLFSSVLEETDDGFFLCDLSGRLLIINRTMAAWVGGEVPELLGKKVVDVIPKALQPLFLGKNEVLVEGGNTFVEEQTIDSDEGAISFLVTKGIHRSLKGNAKGIFGIVRDVSDMRAMEREVIETSDKEKQRLGQELHENLCQYLVGISLLGNALYEDLLKLKLKQGEDARQITGLVKEAIAEVRQLAKGLAPMPEENEEEELISALNELAESARMIGKIPCLLRVPRVAVRFHDPGTAIHLYRIAQEAVHNALKHAEATKLSILLSFGSNGLTLSVEDDGKGFTKSQRNESSSGLGMHIMRYRSRAIGATLEFHRPAKGGSKVVCSVPAKALK